jgi:HSP20 family molecular chaperone IbpA
MIRVFPNILKKTREISKEIFKKNIIPRETKYVGFINYNVYEEDESDIIEFIIPGKTDKDIKITCSNYLINVYIRSRIFSFYLSNSSDTTKIEAELKNGILKIIIPHKKDFEKEIKIKT